MLSHGTASERRHTCTLHRAAVKSGSFWEVKWKGLGFFFVVGGVYETRCFCEAGSGRMGSDSWKHSFVWPRQERIEQKTLNHPVYLRMCAMQKMPFTAWTESGCVAGRLKSSLPRATEKVSVRLKPVSPQMFVNKGFRFIHSFRRLNVEKGLEWVWRISRNCFLCVILSTLAKKCEI